MHIASILLILLAFIANRLHWPFVNLAVLIALLVNLTDVVVQLIRVAMKRVQVSTLLAALALTFLNVGYIFIWLQWPGALITALITLAGGLAFIIYWLISKRKLTVRFQIVLVLFVALSAFATMKPSTLLCFRNDIDPQNPKSSVFMLHHLAWLYNQEGSKPDALRLLLLTQKELNRKMDHFKKEGEPEIYQHIFDEDMPIVANSIQQMTSGSWITYEPLFPEDIEVD